MIVGMDLLYFRRPSVIGAIQGMITGLVAITPAAGFVAGKQFFLLAILSDDSAMKDIGGSFSLIISIVCLEHDHDRTSLNYALLDL